jgi:hypothetical protein
MRGTAEGKPMKINAKLCAVAAMFGLFSAGTIGAAAFLPLERMGQSVVTARTAGHSYVSVCLNGPCRSLKPPNA